MISIKQVMKMTVLNTFIYLVFHGCFVIVGCKPFPVNVQVPRSFIVTSRPLTFVPDKGEPIKPILTSFASVSSTYSKVPTSTRIQFLPGFAKVVCKGISCSGSVSGSVDSVNGGDFNGFPGVAVPIDSDDPNYYWQTTMRPNSPNTDSDKSEAGIVTRVHLLTNRPYFDDDEKSVTTKTSATLVTRRTSRRTTTRLYRRSTTTDPPPKQALLSAPGSSNPLSDSSSSFSSSSIVPTSKPPSLIFPAMAAFSMVAIPVAAAAAAAAPFFLAGKKRRRRRRGVVLWPSSNQRTSDFPIQTSSDDFGDMLADLDELDHEVFPGHRWETIVKDKVQKASSLASRLGVVPYGRRDELDDLAREWMADNIGSTGRITFATTRRPKPRHNLNEYK